MSAVETEMGNEDQDHDVMGKQDMDAQVYKQPHTSKHAETQQQDPTHVRDRCNSMLCCAWNSRNDSW